MASQSGTPLRDLLGEGLVQALLALLALTLVACVLAYAWVRRGGAAVSPAGAEPHPEGEGELQGKQKPLSADESRGGT